MQIKLTRQKKILLLIMTSTVAAIGLDMAFSRSLYHPLNYLYGIFSWTSCRLFPCYPQPTEAVKGERRMVVTGSPGGATIPTTVVQVITNWIDYELDIAEAVNAPRVHYQGLPNWVLTEPFAGEAMGY